jgi:hypothetical protein
MREPSQSLLEAPGLLNVRDRSQCRAIKHMKNGEPSHRLSLSELSPRNAKELQLYSPTIRGAQVPLPHHPQSIFTPCSENVNKILPASKIVTVSA